jgi:AcrR family transcriptional regulator
VGRPRLHDAETAAALLEVAERLVETNGIEAVTVRRLSDEAGTTARAIYSLFGSMDGLMTALGIRAMDLLREHLEALPVTEDRITDVVAAGVDGFRPFALGHVGLFETVFQRREPFAEIRAGLVDAAMAAWQPLHRRIERLPASYRRDRSVVQAGYEFHAACEGLAGLELRFGLSARFPGVWDDTLRALVSGWRSAR